MKKRLLIALCVLFLCHSLAAPVSAVLPDGVTAADTEDKPIALSENGILSVTDHRGAPVTGAENGYVLSAESGSGTQYTVELAPDMGSTLLLAIGENFGITSVTLFFSEDGKTYRTSHAVSLQLSTAEGTVYYPVELPYNENVRYVRIRLSGHPGTQLTLQGVGTPYSAEAFLADPLGEITQTAYSADIKTLSVRGSIDAATSIQYLSYQLALYALAPDKTAAQVGTEGELLKTMPVTQKFDFRVLLDEETLYSKYVVALVGNGEIIPVVDPFYAFEEDGRFAPIGFKGMFADADVDLFDVGAEFAVIELDMGKLLGDGSDRPGTRLYVQNGRYYYLDSAYISTLHKSLYATASAGAASLLYLTDTSEQYYRSGYMDTDAVAVLMDLLGERLNDSEWIDGIILGSNDVGVSRNADALFSYITFLHTVKLLASQRVGDINLYAELPYEEDSARLFAEFSAAMAKESHAPYGVFFRATDVDETVIDRIGELGQVSGPSLPAFCGLLWDVHGENRSFYSAYADRAEDFVDGFAVRTDGADAATKSWLATRIKDFDYHSRYTVLSPLAGAPATALSRYRIVDFAKDSDISLWYDGVGCVTMGLLYAPSLDGKVLAIHAREDADRLTCLYIPEAPLDLTRATALKVSFAVLFGQAPEKKMSGELVFVSGSKRAVVPLDNISHDELMNVYVSLDSFGPAANIERVALSVYGAEVSHVYVCDVEACSDTLTEAELEAAVHGTAEKNGDEEVKQLDRSVILFALLGVITLVIVMFLSRRRAEEE